MRRHVALLSLSLLLVSACQKPPSLTEVPASLASAPEFSKAKVVDLGDRNGGSLYFRLPQVVPPAGDFNTQGFNVQGISDIAKYRITLTNLAQPSVKYITEITPLSSSDPRAGVIFKNIPADNWKVEILALDLVGSSITESVAYTDPSPSDKVIMDDNPGTPGIDPDNPNDTTVNVIVQAGGSGQLDACIMLCPAKDIVDNDSDVRINIDARENDQTINDADKVSTETVPVNDLKEVCPDCPPTP